MSALSCSSLAPNTFEMDYLSEFNVATADSAASLNAPARSTYDSSSNGLLKLFFIVTQMYFSPPPRYSLSDDTHTSSVTPRLLNAFS